MGHVFCNSCSVPIFINPSTFNSQEVSRELERTDLSSDEKKQLAKNWNGENRVKICWKCQYRFHGGDCFGESPNECKNCVNGVPGLGTEQAFLESEYQSSKRAIEQQLQRMVSCAKCLYPNPIQPFLLNELKDLLNGAIDQ